MRDSAICPPPWTETLARRATIAEAAQELAPSRRYWAIVGSGANRVAAEEIRIKLSELCYKAIASDAIEDKKHIDLSSEPLILVCAAGLIGSNADDVAKEVAIYRAHKATPIVIATEDEDRFNAALRVITVPSVLPELAFVLTTVVGHLFGYEAALAIDAQARGLREARGAIEDGISSPAVADVERLLADLRPTFEPIAARFHDGLRSGAYNGSLEAGTAVRLASMFRYALGIAPLDAYQVEHGRVGTPSVVIEDLTSALTAAIEELTRPVDAIKHQAKTVTVGISRSDESLLDVALVAGHARRRRRSRPAQLQGPAHPRRPRRRRSTRSSATPATASRATWRRVKPPSSWSTGAGSLGTCRSAPSGTRCCEAPSTASPPSARSPWPSAAATAAPSCWSPRSRATSAPASPCCTPASATSSPPGGCARCSRPTAGATPPSRTRSPRPSPPSATTCSGCCRPSNCSPPRSTCWPTGGGRVTPGSDS